MFAIRISLVFKEFPPVKLNVAFASAVLCAASCALWAQGPYSSSTDANPEPAAAVQRPIAQAVPYHAGAFSRMSFGAGVSPLGVGVQLTTNINPHLNIRAMGNQFKYSNSFTVSNVPASAKLNLESAGVMADYYPFHKGFRLSGGALFLNHNQVNAATTLAGGDSIDLDGNTYYSANANPVTGATPLNGAGKLVLNTRRPAAVLTTGWGNHVKRNGHLSFPFEIGAAFVGAPKATMNLTGWACADAAQTECTNVADPNNSIAADFQSNLSSQIAKWNKDLEPLKTYPIVSAGVAYSFGTRRVR